MIVWITVESGTLGPRKSCETSLGFSPGVVLPWQIQWPPPDGQQPCQPGTSARVTPLLLIFVYRREA